MGFDSILKQWENRQKPPAGPKKNSPGDDSVNWLDSYPPDSEVLAEKSKDNTAPVSGGTSVWLRRRPQDTLDLHGLTGREARHAMAGFFSSMQNRGLRKGLIIHGKGMHSTEGSVLAPLVRQYLEMSSEIGGFGRASRKDGGSGATWFILRQRSR